jgi:putative photosynthetic complex assembly protein 2
VADYGLPVLYVLFIWWFSTGLILYLDGLPYRTFRWSMLGATALLVIGLHGLVITSSDVSVGGAYLAFTSGLLIWGWHETSFLMGLVTGPRKTPCAPDATGWRRFLQGTQAVLYHELAILLTAAVMLALTWGMPNQIATWTFLVLWVMRLSAKLNVFLGVPNLSEEFLPDHLHYLESFIARRPMNLLFPVSVMGATVVGVLLVLEALAAEPGSFELAGSILVAALLGLAVLEHWFLVLPLPDAALWSWALRSRERREPEPADEAAEGFPAPEKYFLRCPLAAAPADVRAVVLARPRVGLVP